MNSSAVPSASPRGRVQFILLAVLFFFPLLVSYALYFWFPEFRPTGKTNYGGLVVPARPLPVLKLINAKQEALDVTVFQGRWTYVLLAGRDCDETCLRDLVMTRQVRIAVNEKRSRVQRILVLADPANLDTLAKRLAPEHPDLRVLGEAGAPGARLADVLLPSDAAAYLIDPHGNWLMVYRRGGETQADFKGMQKDINKLLRLSQIG